MFEANYLFCQKSITLQDVHFDQSESKDLANTPLHLPVSLNDFLFLFLPQHTQMHTHTHPAEQDTQGWQTRSSVICQPPPGGNIKDRPHKCVSVFVCRCVFVRVPAKLGVAVMLYELIKQLIRNLVWCFLASTWGGVEWREEDGEAEQRRGKGNKEVWRRLWACYTASRDHNLNTFEYIVSLLLNHTRCGHWNEPGLPHVCEYLISQPEVYCGERDF